MLFAKTLVALLFSASTVLATPVPLAKRDVWVPSILDPNSTTEWHAGGTYNVTWALDKKPVNVSNPLGTIYLSKGGVININEPLAKDFPLIDGNVSVTVSNTTVAGSDYAVILVGDSKNASPTFNITLA